MMSEKEFWSWFSAERAKQRMIEERRRLEEAPTLFEWLEQELSEARNVEMKQRAKLEAADYWQGYADALQDVLNAIKMRRVRV